MIRNQIVVDHKLWDAVWFDGYQKIKEWLERPTTNPDFKIEHALRMLQRIKGVCEDTYRGDISTL